MQRLTYTEIIASMRGPKPVVASAPHGAIPESLYSRTSGRHVCGDTVKLLRTGQWVHADHAPTCRNAH